MYFLEKQLNQLKVKNKPQEENINEGTCSSNLTTS